MATLILLAPLFLVFEFVQLVLSERYLGIKQIARGADPRTLGLSEVTAFFWTMAILGYGLWMMLLLTLPLTRFPAMGLMVVSMIGYSVRRGCGLKWVLVILTFEGALRISLLGMLCWLVWRRI